MWNFTYHAVLGLYITGMEIMWTMREYMDIKVLIDFNWFVMSLHE